MKISLKKLIPKKIKSVIIHFKNNKIIKNYFQTKYKRNALISYIVVPFKKSSLSHTNYYEVQSWAKILSELGYNVDIIHYENNKNIDLLKYDLICGFGDVFQYYFEGKYSHAKTIYYGAGMHVCHQNYASLSRVKDVYKKKGIWLGKSARFVEKTWTHQTTLVDGIIALGNYVCAESYKKYYDGMVLSLPAPFYKVQDARLILKNRIHNSNKDFLWFGSFGLVHKGLDLLLDFFSKNQEYTLHICGDIENEKDFIQAYKQELSKTNNIINHGFIDIQGDKFAEILTLCSFVIYPSCSEGGSPSVITAIGNGGLIPVITKETTVSTGFEIMIETLDEVGISNAVKKAKQVKAAELLDLSKKNLDYVLQNHSQEHYQNQLKIAIGNVLGNDL